MKTIDELQVTSRTGHNDSSEREPVSINCIESLYLFEIGSYEKDIMYTVFQNKQIRQVS